MPVSRVGGHFARLFSLGGRSSGASTITFGVRVRFSGNGAGGGGGERNGKSGSAASTDASGASLGKLTVGACLRLAFRVLRALLYRVCDGLLVFFVGVVLFRAAAAGYFITRVVVPASVRVVAEASITAVSSLTIYTVRGGVVV